MFTFELNEQVVIKKTGVAGVVHGRAEYIDSASQYYVMSHPTETEEVKAWFNGDDLIAG